MGSSISPAAIAGTVIGGIAALVLGLVLVLWLHRKSQRDRKAAALPEPRPQEPPASVFKSYINRLISRAGYDTQGNRVTCYLFRQYTKHHPSSSCRADHTALA
ncbi:Putative protein of unknown function [Podospora comata]|uniref:Epidermal growth factor receptor-like transmembrane-juxtamembrane segment domain-containing protein n=1 Tax=Podospora comata TaxID=48703 RepID=A0ABY6SBE6_PODCO|nr:Putative protein of unknown function [Podospora comata]